MTHQEIVKEADRIVTNKFEAWDYIFNYLQHKEFEKLNCSKVYECLEDFSWYISMDGQKDLLSYPFGFFFADYLNQLNSLQSKEAFIAYEKRMRSGASSEKYVNPTFDKRSRYFVWHYNQHLGYNEAERTYSIVSDRELETVYDECCWLWEYIKDDVKGLINLLKYAANNQIKHDDIFQTYRFVRYFILKIWMLQQRSHDFNTAFKGFDLSDDEVKAELKDITGIAADDEFIIKNTSSQFRYMGYETIVQSDGANEKKLFCKKYDIPNLLFLVPEDLMHFLLHQTTHTFGFCPECDCMFVTTHGNQKHCPACNLIIRQKKRKENKERYLHKKITDYINNYLDEESENTSEAFRNESNYYWAIVQGKKPEKIKGYSTKIKTKADYMEWLEKKYEELKAQR